MRILRHDDFPQPKQIGQVAGKLAFGAVASGGADDEAQALGRIQFVHDVAQAAAQDFVLDFPRHADASQGGHQHQVPAGNADVRGERGALAADAFLDDLHQQFVAAAEDVLDGRLETRAAAGIELFALRGVAGRAFIVEFGGVGPGVAAVSAARPAPGFAVIEGFFRIVAALAEILGLDVAYVQKAVPAHAEIDERRLDAGLQVDDHALVDVSYVIVLSRALDVEFFQHSVFNHGDAAFLGLGDVDQHFLLHKYSF